MKIKIAVFCSGSGSNAEKIFEHFKHHPTIEVALLLANTDKAFAIERAKNHGIPFNVFSKDEFKNGGVLKTLIDHEISWVVLAGFLWLIPEHLVAHFENKMINIHPALLPKYGGKGMYGHYVHEEIVKNKETESGITIHLVNTQYDEGKVLFQASCFIAPTDTASDVAKKVQLLEHTHFAATIESTILTSAKS